MKIPYIPKNEIENLGSGENQGKHIGRIILFALYVFESRQNGLRRELDNNVIGAILRPVGARLDLQ